MKHNFFHKLLLCAYVLGSATADHSIFCEFCCPNLFGSSSGTINVRSSSSLLHSISYILRCLMSTEEVVIVSDGTLSRPIWLDWFRNNNDRSRKRVCTQAENVLISHVRATDFLESNPGYFQKLVPTYDPGRSPFTFATMTAKRINFIFIPNSQEQMILLISKVEQDFYDLRAGRKFFWQPYIIFLWPQVQHHDLRDQSCNKAPGENLLQTWFENLQPYFTLDSGVFFFFIVQKGNSPRSRTNLHLSLWEGYKLKGKFFFQTITKQSGSVLSKITRTDEECNSTLRNASPMLAWMEKVNSYIFVERFSRRDNFKLLPVTASIVPSDSTDWIVIKRNEQGVVILESGSSVDMYKDFQIMMNFSEDVLIGDGIQYLDTRNQSPSSYQQSAFRADILLNQKSVSPGRGQIYSFLQPTYFGIYEAFFRQPSANAIRNIVSAPFTISLWAILIITWLLIIGCLYGWGYVAKRNCLIYTNDDSIFIQEIWIWAIAAISQKSWYISPSSVNFQTIYYIGSIMALVCYAAYSAMIVSFLTVRIVPIQSLNDLVEYNYKFTVHESSDVTVTLLEAMITTYNLPQNVIKITTENEITHLKYRTQALLSYPDLFYKTADQQNYTENFICANVYSLPVGNIPYKSSMSVKKGSQFRETFSTKLLVIIESGLNYRYKKIYDNSKAINCPKKNYDNARTIVDPVRLTDVFTTFLVIFIGWIIAVWMFFTERLYKRRSSIYSLIFLFQ